VRWRITLLASFLILGLWAAPASAQDLDEIADELLRSGVYSEFDTSGDANGINQAQQANTAFAWIDTDADAEELAIELIDRVSPSYATVVVLASSSVGAQSDEWSTSEIDDALDAGLDAFAVGDPGTGLEQFIASLGSSRSTTATTTGGSTSSSGDSSSSGGGFRKILLGLLVAGGGFVAFRAFSGSRKKKKALETEIALDRAEIKEQLLDNADNVINLGERVTGNAELERTYEEASRAYQDVSQSIDSAQSAEEIDALDDKIDKAEWQFDVIEASLEGRPVPLSPEETAAAEAKAKAEAEKSANAPGSSSRGSDRPAVGRDESVFGPGSRPSVPRSQPRSRRAGRSRGMGGGVGRRRSGGVGGILGGVLGSILSSGGGGFGGGSRRSSRRGGLPGGIGIPGGFPSGGSRSGSRRRSSGLPGGLGGGVLKKGGSRSSRGGGGRSFGRGSKSRGGGGRRF